MLDKANVQTMLPVKDLGAAERFYSERLGLGRECGQARSPRPLPSR